MNKIDALTLSPTVTIDGVDRSVIVRSTSINKDNDRVQLLIELPVTAEHSIISEDVFLSNREVSGVRIVSQKDWAEITEQTALLQQIAKNTGATAGRLKSLDEKSSAPNTTKTHPTSEEIICQRGQIVMKDQDKRYDTGHIRFSYPNASIGYGILTSKEKNINGECMIIGKCDDAILYIPKVIITSVMGGLFHTFSCWPDDHSSLFSLMCDDSMKSGAENPSN